MVARLMYIVLSDFTFVLTLNICSSEIIFNFFLMSQICDTRLTGTEITAVHAPMKNLTGFVLKGLTLWAKFEILQKNCTFVFTFYLVHTIHTCKYLYTG